MSATLEDRLRVLVADLPDADARLVGRAFRVAEAAHAGQTRRHAEPYISHPLAVAEIAHAVFSVSDGAVLAAALLHDVLEDTDLTAADLEEFPVRTGRLVTLLTDPHGGMTLAERHDHYARIWKDPDATLLKCSDRLSNLDDSLRIDDGGAFARRYAAKTRRDFLAPGQAPGQHPVAGPRLQVAVRRCEGIADASVTRARGVED